MTAATVRAAPPCGSCTARVQRPRGTSTVVLHFTRQGQVFLLPGGAGRWWPAGPGRFRFTLTEAVLTADGGFGGWVQVNQEAQLRGDGFSSSGTSVVHGVDGERAYEAPVTIHALLPG